MHHLPRPLRLVPYFYGRDDIRALRHHVISCRGNALEAPCRGAAVLFMEYGHHLRVVAQDYVGDVEVSTVFLSINHGFGDGPPVLWESMVFSGPDDGMCQRYTSEGAAKEGHLDMLEGQNARAAEGLTEGADRPEA
jgi:hypothetical protein